MGKEKESKLRFYVRALTTLIGPQGQEIDIFLLRKVLVKIKLKETICGVVY